MSSEWCRIKVIDPWCRDGWVLATGIRPPISGASRSWTGRKKCGSRVYDSFWSSLKSDRPRGLGRPHQKQTNKLHLQFNVVGWIETLLTTFCGKKMDHLASFAATTLQGSQYDIRFIKAQHFLIFTAIIFRPNFNRNGDISLTLKKLSQKRNCWLLLKVSGSS